jgi:hypothetical protein
LRKLALAAAASALAAPAAAQLRPSPLNEIYQSYNDCFKVATAGGLKPEVLGPLGWSRAKVSGGAPAASDPIIFGHAQRRPLILLSAEQGQGLCIVMARLENAGAFDEFKKAWGGKLPKPDAEGAISFSAEGHIVQLRQTGTRQAPSLSLAVMTPTESK